MIGVIWLILSLQVLTLDPVYMLGCSLGNSNVNTSLTFPFKANFGAYDSVKPIKFKDEDSFKQFLYDISDVYMEFVESGLSYNTLSEYLRFHKKYQAAKDDPQYTFPSFYQSYEVQTALGDEPGGNFRALMEKLTKQNSELESSSYYVTRSQLLHEEQIKEIDPTSEELPKYFEHDQIAAIIKFTYGGIFRNKVGYILLDFEIEAPGPVVFMNNGHQITVDDETLSPVQFEVLNRNGKSISNSQYIAAKISGVDGTYLYYFRKPYCSIVETTVKPSLLKFQHIAERRDHYGTLITRLSANVGLDGSGAKVFDVEIASLEHWDEVIKHKIELGDLQKYKDDFIKLSWDLGMTAYLSEDGVTKCTEIIQSLQDIYNDDKFLSECQSLLKSLNES